MVHLQSDNRKAEKHLRAIIDILSDSGAYIDDDIVIHCEDGCISVRSPQNAAPRPLFKIPHELLLPYDLFEIAIKKGRFILKGSAPKATKPQRQLIKHMLELYNVTDQLKRHRQNCPWLVYKDQKPIIDALLEAREGEDIKTLRNLFKDPPGQSEELECLTFFKTRLLRCHLHKRFRKARAVLLPLVDSLNHHIKGAGYDHIYADDGAFLSLQARCPGQDAECMASYGRLDALDTLLHYAFIDETAPFVRSIPLTIELPDYGTLEIRGLDAKANPEQIPENLKDLGFYMPTIEIRQNRQHATFSHLFIPQQGAPLSLKRILHATLEMMQPENTSEKHQQSVANAENQIITANLKHYNKILSTYESIDSPEISPLIHKIFTLQKQKVENYKNL